MIMVWIYKEVENTLIEDLQIAFRWMSQWVKKVTFLKILKLLKFVSPFLCFEFFWFWLKIEFQENAI